MQIRPLEADDPGAMAAWHATYLAADVAGREHGTPWMLEELRASFTGGRTGEEVLPLAGTDEGEVVCCGLVELPVQDNRHMAWGKVWTRPDRRGLGFGSAMLDRVLDIAVDRDRSVLTTDVFAPVDGPEDGSGTPDADWVLRRGFALDLSNLVRVLDLPADEERVRRLAEEAAPFHGDYTLRQFRGPIPGDIALEFGRLVGALMVEAPSGEVEKEHEVMDLDRIRADEAVFEASGRTKYTTVAVAPDGSLAAYTELVVPTYDPGHVFQWGTLVLPEHRGHRLGMATKAHNLLWVQREEPGRTALVTCNAEVNQHMIGVNEALGFRPVEREVGLVKKLS